MRRFLSLTADCSPYVTIAHEIDLTLWKLLWPPRLERPGLFQLEIIRTFARQDFLLVVTNLGKAGVVEKSFPQFPFISFSSKRFIWICIRVLPPLLSVAALSWLGETIPYVSKSVYRRTPLSQ